MTEWRVTGSFEKFYKICQNGKSTHLYLSILPFWKSFIKFMRHPSLRHFLPHDQAYLWAFLNERWRVDLVDFPFPHIESFWCNPSSLHPSFRVSIQLYEQEINPYFRSHILWLFVTLFAVPSLVSESLLYFVHTTWPFSFTIKHTILASAQGGAALAPLPPLCTLGLRPLCDIFMLWKDDCGNETSWIHCL